MVSVRNFLVGVLMVTGVTATAVYTSSCSKSKDACSGVTCQNSGSCKSGTCVCPAGIGGTNCETIYRTTYANIYAGSGTDNETPSRTLNNYQVTLSYNNDLNYSGMNILAEMLDGGGKYVTHFTAPIVLSSCSATGSNFTITPSVNSLGFRISGTGTVSASVVTLSVTEADTATTGYIQPTIVYTFSSLAVQ